MTRNIRYQFVLVYTVPATAKRIAVEDVAAAVDAGALRVGAVGLDPVEGEGGRGAA
jgi:hypothetical protein